MLVFAVFIFWGAGNLLCQNSDAINKYANYLTGLSSSDFKNISRAIEYYEKNISSLSPEERDYGYAEFRKFYNRVDSVFGIKLGTGDPNYTPGEKIYSKCVDPKFDNDNDVIKFKKTLSENGFNISLNSIMIMMLLNLRKLYLKMDSILVWEVSPDIMLWKFPVL